MRTVEPITAEIVLDDFELIQQALFNRHLSRTFDKRTYEEGNVREGVVSILHGKVHRNRRRIENTQFRVDQLKLYERELFPPIVEQFVTDATRSGEADLFPLGELLAVVLAAKRAGFDFDMDNRDELMDLVHYVTAFSQASAIIDARDPDAVREMVYEALANFKDQFGMPSLERRQAILDRFGRGEIPEDDLPHDILTNLLRHRDDPEMELTDDFRIIREAATYLQGGTHTSSQTTINAFDLLFDLEDPRDYWERLKTDRAFAQRVMHETLRLRATTPRAKRRAEEATTVGDIEVPAGAMVVLDLMVGNRSKEHFGADAEEFNPDREVPERVPRWGLSFGAGPHICPGRNVAGGLPQADLPSEDDLGENHLFGLVPIMLQAIAKREPRRHPDKPQARDDRTERFTRWDEYWVVFDNPM